MLFIKLFLLMMVFSCSTGEKSIYVLPENFTGYVIVIYNQENGAEKKYADDKRVYEIPPIGILKTQFETDYGWAEFPEFYYQKIDADRKIPLVIEFEDYSEDKINATMLSTGKSYKNVDGTGAIEYSTFFIGVKSQIKKASSELEKIHIADLVETE